MNSVPSVYPASLSLRQMNFMKRRLLGLCGRESIKRFDEIVDAFLLPDYIGYVSIVREAARAAVTKGEIPYRDGKRIAFKRLFSEGSEELYRVRLENPYTGWEVH